MATHRRERLEELIKRIVAETILSEVKDPRIGFVSVVKVKLSKDYSVAETYVSVLGDDVARRKSMAGLESACNYIQSLMAKELKLRITPRIVFHLDTSVEDGVRIVGVIDELGTGSDIDHEGPTDNGGPTGQNGG